MDFDEDDTIVNPAQYEDKPEWGIVMGVGPEVTELEVGDVVIFGAYSSITVRSHGQDFFFVRGEDVMGNYQSKDNINRDADLGIEERYKIHGEI